MNKLIALFLYKSLILFIKMSMISNEFTMPLIKDLVFGNCYHCLERSFYSKKINQQVHQEHSRSYKEVCAPVIERCRFLFNELRPAVGNEVNAMSRSCLLKSTPRWKKVSIKMMEDKRRSKRCKGIYSFFGSHMKLELSS